MGNGIGFTSHGRETVTSKTKKSSKKTTKVKSSYYDKYDDYYGDGGYYNNWSWGSYGSYGSSFSEDDDSKLFIKNHESYFTPKSTDIGLRLNYGTNSEYNRNIIKEMSRFFYYKMLQEKGYFDDRFKDLTKLSEEEIVQLSEKKKFYNELWDRFVPGMSPLEKALAVFSEIEAHNGKGKDRYTAEDLNRGAEKMRFNEDTYGDPLYNELLDISELKNRKMAILSKLSMIKNLGSEFKIEKEIEERVVDNSRILSNRMMTNYSQIGNVEMYQRLMPNFPIKLLTKDLVVKVPVDKTDHKQKIIMLLDYSGSMNEEAKQEWVVAIMLDRLRYAMKEEAEIFFSYFIDNPSHMHFTHVYDRTSAIEFWSHFSTRPSGGTTNIGAMVDSIKYDIENGSLGNLDIDLSKEMPEILVINDGDDQIRTSAFSYKTNAISLFNDNKELMGLCIKNKGKYVVAKTESLTTYNGVLTTIIEH